MKEPRKEDLMLARTIVDSNETVNCTYHIGGKSLLAHDIARSLQAERQRTIEWAVGILDGAAIELETEVNRHLRKDGTTIMSMPPEVHLYRTAAALVRFKAKALAKGPV